MFDVRYVYFSFSSFIFVPFNCDNSLVRVYSYVFRDVFVNWLCGDESLLTFYFVIGTNKFKVQCPLQKRSAFEIIMFFDDNLLTSDIWNDF